MAKMVGVSSLTSKRPNYGTIRQHQSVSWMQKPAKPNKNQSESSNDSSILRGFDVNSGLSLQVSNWRERQSDDSTGASNSIVMPLDSDKPSSLPLSQPKFSSFRTCSVRRLSSTSKAMSTSSHLADNSASIGRPPHLSPSTYGQSANVDECLFDMMQRTQLLETDDGRTIDLFDLRRSSQGSTSSSNGDGMCKLTPVSSVNSSGDAGYNQVTARKHTVTPNESQRAQLLAALRAAKATPRKSVDPAFSMCLDAFQNLSLGSVVNSTEAKTTRDDVKITTPRASGLPVPRRHQASDSQRDSQKPVTPVSNSIGTGNHDEGKYQLMLCKLNKKTLPGREREKEAVHSACDKESVLTGFQQRHSATSGSDFQLRRPTHGRGRRFNTESDPTVHHISDPVAYTRASRSADCGSISSQDKSNSLNPKAREFLSFSKTGSEVFSTSRRQFPSSCEISANEDCSDGPTEDAENPRADFCENANYNVLSLAPTVGLSTIYQNTLRAQNLRGFASGIDPADLRLVPVTMNTYRSTPASIPGWPIAPLNPSLLDGTAHDSLKSSFPSLTPIPAIPGLPCLSMPPGTGAATGDTTISGTVTIPPRPVPKPKNPNPKSQQEYEAWVEWRKANEPGYAMACKLRQQRRAQRNTAQQSKPERNKKCE